MPASHLFSLVSEFATPLSIVNYLKIGVYKHFNNLEEAFQDTFHETN